MHDTHQVNNGFDEAAKEGQQARDVGSDGKLGYDHVTKAYFDDKDDVVN